VRRHTNTVNLVQCLAVSKRGTLVKYAFTKWKHSKTNVIYVHIVVFNDTRAVSVIFNMVWQVVQFETRNFGHHYQYNYVVSKKGKIGFTLLTSILPSLIDMRLT
jgi:hypothetical protein